MRGRRSSRSAAVVLAGCVGLAVIAPGLALAAPITSATTEAECDAAGGSWIGGACEDTSSTTTTTSTAADTDTSSSVPSGGVAPVIPAEGTTDVVDGGGSSLPGSGSERSSAARTGPTATEPTTETTTTTAPTTTGGDDATGAGAPVARATVADTGQQLAQQLTTIQLPDGTTLPITFEPGKGNLPLGGNRLTELPSNPTAQQLCRFFASGLSVPDAQVTQVSQALTGLCDRLAVNGTADPGQVQQEVVRCYHECVTFDVRTVYFSYWNHRYDVDCDELSYDEANAILDWDRSDPFRLDADGDGVACEWNAHDDDEVAYVHYDGYPEGGVSTGDGSTETGASDVEVALAAGALAGLGVTSMVVVRRFARQG
ncbi:excalibur calcium-binding domain-containing protein [Actinomycetospora sp. C-140]